MQTIDALTKELRMLIDDHLYEYDNNRTMSLQKAYSKHTQMVGRLEAALYDAFKQLPVDYVEKVVDRFKKV